MRERVREIERESLPLCRCVLDNILIVIIKVYFMPSSSTFITTIMLHNTSYTCNLVRRLLLKLKHRRHPSVFAHYDVVV